MSKYGNKADTSHLKGNVPNAFSPDTLKQLFMPRPTGRPFRFDNVEELNMLMEEYFRPKLEPVYNEETGIEEGWRWKSPVSITSLAVWLGMSSATFNNYNKRDEYYQIFQTARSIIESYYEYLLMENRNPAGMCFTLKNNFGWKDVQDFNMNTKTLVGEVQTNAQLEQMEQEVLALEAHSEN